MQFFKEFFKTQDEIKKETAREHEKRRLLNEDMRIIEMQRNVTADEFYERGMAYRRNGKLDEAISEYTNAIVTDQNCAKAYNSRGATFEIQGKLTDAFYNYTKAVSIAPDDWPARKNLERFLLESKYCDLVTFKREDILAAIKLLPQKKQEKIIDYLKTIELNCVEEKSTMETIEKYVRTFAVLTLPDALNGYISSLRSDRNIHDEDASLEMLEISSNCIKK